MRYYLAITTSVLAFTSASLVRAQDCAITDCSALGYTESSNQGNCLKCPFGNAWACPGEQCTDDYKYTCSGTGYAGGSGEACGGKYKSCNCASGYEWKDGVCKEEPKTIWGQCSGRAKNCRLGDIVYSDGTCSKSKDPNKTPIAVVIYKSGKCAQAIALNSIGSYQWSNENTDISGLGNFQNDELASYDTDSCLNTKEIIATGDKNKYPAAWAAHEYKTEGTKAGDWCLPAAAILSFYNDDTVSGTVKSNIINAGGSLMNEGVYVWSSTEYNSGLAWVSFTYSSFGLTNTYKSSSIEVRPVIEF